MCYQSVSRFGLIDPFLALVDFLYNLSIRRVVEVQPVQEGLGQGLVEGSYWVSKGVPEVELGSAAIGAWVAECLRWPRVGVWASRGLELLFRVFLVWEKRAVWGLGGRRR